jgi:hypothetical protein
MNKIKKGVLLASVMAVAAFAMPAMASAANWGIPNTNQNLSGSNFGFVITEPGVAYGFGACTGVGLGVHVRAPASSTLDITSATGFTCAGFGVLANCNVTATPTALPWTASGASTTDVTLNTIKYTVVFTSSGGSCAFAGASFSLEGTLTGGVWNAAGHSVTYSSDPGLRLKRPVVSYDKAVSTTGTLTQVAPFQGFLSLS